MSLQHDRKSVAARAQWHTKSAGPARMRGKQGVGQVGWMWGTWEHVTLPHYPLSSPHTPQQMVCQPTNAHSVLDNNSNINLERCFVTS